MEAEMANTENIEIRVFTAPTEQGCQCLICPKCKAHEIEDCKNTEIEERRFNIRAFKVDDNSHCLKCNCWFDLKGNFVVE